MMQKLHFQRITALVILFAAFLVAPLASKAQYSEALVNSEYRDIILKQLQKNSAAEQDAIRNYANSYLLSLPNDRKLYDESKMNIKTDLVSGIDRDGLRELNYRIVVNYSCHHFENTTDNYPTGKYLCQQSNAASAIVNILHNIVDNYCAKAFKPGKRVDITLKASTDITPVTKLDYNGEYGDFRYIAARYNDEPVRISVSSESGITSNAQLAFLRAQGLQAALLEQCKALKLTDNNFSYHTRSVSETGSQYRDVGVEIIIHGAFDEEIVLMNERLVNDEFVDYNIPKTAENSNLKTYALIIANERYNAPLPNVPYAYADGENLQQYCIRTLGIPARQVRIIEDASLQDIRTQGVDWFKDIAKSQKGDCNFILYFAGHGLTDFDHNPYIIPTALNYKKIKALRNPADFTLDKPLTKCETKKLLKQCLRVDTLCSWFNRLPMKSLTIFIDASFDGNQRDGSPLINIKHSKNKPKGLRIRNDIVLITAAPFNQTAYAFDEQHHGFFTYFLLKELKKTKGNIDLQNLFNNIDRNLQDESALQGLLQTPAIYVGGKLKDTWGNIRLGAQ